MLLIQELLARAYIGLEANVVPENALKKHVSTKNSANFGLIQRFKERVVPVRQRPSAWDDLTKSIIANRLELPHTTNQLQVANMQARIGQYAADTGADGV